MTAQPHFNPSSVSDKNMTLRYIESLEDRVARLEKREALWIGKVIGMWIALVAMIGKLAGVY